MSCLINIPASAGSTSYTYGTKISLSRSMVSAFINESISSLISLSYRVVLTSTSGLSKLSSLFYNAFGLEYIFRYSMKCPVAFFASFN